MTTPTHKLLCGKLQLSLYLAVDIWDDDWLERVKTDFMLHLAAAAEKNRLTTGIRWDLPADKVAAIDGALARRDWYVPLAVGWNPLHVEPTGITISGG